MNTSWNKTLDRKLLTWMFVSLAGAVSAGEGEEGIPLPVELKSKQIGVYLCSFIFNCKNCCT
jgi:hypothetical protein